MRTEPIKRELARDKETLSMNLPEGKNCGDCSGFRACASFLGSIEADERCDWYPSRFREKVEA